MKIAVALAQIDVVPGRPDLNTEAILAAIEKARHADAELVIFPEMAVPGYFLGDLWEQPAFLRDCEAFGQEIVEAARNICVVFGNVATDREKKGTDGRPRKYNALFVAQNGQLCGAENFPYPFRIKTLQPNYREFDDERHFFSSIKLAVELGRPVEELLQPVNVVLQGHSVSLACILCEDGWDSDYSVKPTRILADNGNPDLVINISSSPFTLGKNNKRNRVFSAQAASLGMPLIYVNATGLQNVGKTVYAFDGYSTVYDAEGSIIRQCDPFSEELTIFDLPVHESTTLQACEPVDDSGIDSIFRTLEYAGRRMLANIGMKKVVIGASGGIDSAVSAALYAHILGPQNVLLINMPSQYNSRTTRDLAEELAKNLGCLYTVVPIQDAVDLTLEQLNRCTITNLSSGEIVDLYVAPIVAENIQARDRSARVLAAFASALGGGFSCNGNKTEMTVGYATLYGDLAGFMAILADLWKYQVYELGRYLNETVFRREVIPADIFTIVPSAELSDQQAVDEGKGDPLHYDYHDRLFRAFMEWWEPASPEELLEWFSEGRLGEKLGCEESLVQQLFPDAASFIADLERWWSLFKGLGIAKRIQAPPVVAVSRRAYGFDYREAQNSVYYSRRYRALKQSLLD